MAKKTARKKLDTVPLVRLEVQEFPIDDIKPNYYNPNRQTDTEFEMLCRSIEEDGYTQPSIVVRLTQDFFNKEPKLTELGYKVGDLMIVDGEHRWRALKAIGKKTIQVTVTEMSLEQVMISTLRHNRARGSENAQMAADVIRQIKDLGGIDQAVEGLLLDEVELDMFLNTIPASEVNLRNIEVPVTAEDVQRQIETEKQQEAARQVQEKKQAIQEANSFFTITLRTSFAELTQIKLALSTFSSKNISEQFLQLLKTYENDSDALSSIQEG